MLVDKIGKIEAISLILIIVVNELVLNIPDIIILFSGTGATINIIFVSILAIIFTFIICKLLKTFYGKDILDVSEYLGGKYLKIIVGSLFILFFILISCLSVRYLANSLKVIYFIRSPIVFLMLLFLVPVVIVNKMGLKPISGVNLIFMPVILVSLIILLFSSYNNFTIQRLFPILGKGFNEVFLSGTTNIFAFTGLAYLLFMPPLLKNIKDFKGISIISISISAVCLFLSIISLLMTFPAITYTDELLSIYLLTRMISFGNFLERIDAIFIFIWIISLMCFLSLTFYYILTIIQKIFKLENSKTLTYPLGLIVLGGAQIIQDISQMKFLSRYIYKYSFLILVFGISLIILILGNIKHKRSTKSIRRSNED